MRSRRGALLQDADEEVIRQYNPLYDRGYDLQEVDANTKVSYGAVRAVFPFKPRDTVTRVAFRELPASAGGGNVVLQRAVKHPSMPKRSGYVRAGGHATGWSLTTAAKHRMQLRANCL